MKSISKKIEKLEAYASRAFMRNVAAVASGAVMAQIITVLFAPLIARFYGPEIFGLQSIFFSVVSILIIVAPMSYPIAIVLPKQDSEAIGLAKLSLVIAAVFCIITTLILGVFGTKILQLINAEKIEDFIYFVPPAIFGGVVNNVINQWLIRKKAFAFTARYNVFTTLLVSILKSGLGYFYPSAVSLIGTNIFGTFLSSLITYIGWKSFLLRQMIADNVPQFPQPDVKLRHLAWQYNDFLLLRTPQNLINAISQSLPILWLATYSGPSASGQYSIAITVLATPINLISGAVMAVFYPRINEAIRNGENVRSLIVKATIGMALTGGTPFLVIILAGPWLFETLFGANWIIAGKYSQWLSLWVFLQFINKPAVSAIPGLKLQGGLLVYEFFSTGLKILALSLGLNIFKSDIMAVALFSIFGVVSYAWLIYWVVKRSGEIVHV